MLAANVLCIKKKKRRSYSISNSSDYYSPRSNQLKRSPSGTVAMMHITEDTPPDMLTGAMDLTVHLPTGQSVKMSVERSTPMMDLLVQIATAHHLQLSSYILEALEMAPCSERRDRVLPYKPNTPIGALDTQHIRVVPKSRTLPVSKTAPPGHQPFESTFRLKVHLPRNQLYVVRVSQNVLIEDIMRKVCYEKNLDQCKYEVRHPGNLDEILDAKLKLSDYQITEIYLVSKGTVSITQTFSSNDIMVLRKEEERKQLHNKTGGGVFSLIFKRGKSTMGSGSLSSDNRSISPSHSDDSRSVTPPVVAQKQPEAPGERPKPPQRKRRPAPKPPQQQQQQQQKQESKPPSQISAASEESSTSQQQKSETGLTICHSRNSSDSSGYHEPSTLSDHCNTTLPRKSQSVLIEEVVGEPSNLAQMASHSKSTTSLQTGRKKKAAPPPPPLVVEHEPKPISSLDPASPLLVVASHPNEDLQRPVPLPRTLVHKASKAPEIPSSSVQSSIIDEDNEEVAGPETLESNCSVVEEEPLKEQQEYLDYTNPDNEEGKLSISDEKEQVAEEEDLDCTDPEKEEEKLLTSEDVSVMEEEVEEEKLLIPDETLVNIAEEALVKQERNAESRRFDFKTKSKSVFALNSNFDEEVGETKSENGDQRRTKPQIVACIPKSKSELSLNQPSSTFTRKLGFRIGAALMTQEDFDGMSVNSSILSERSDSLSFYSNQMDDCGFEDLNENLFSVTSKAEGRSSGVHSFSLDGEEDEDLTVVVGGDLNSEIALKTHEGEISVNKPQADVVKETVNPQPEEVQSEPVPETQTQISVDVTDSGKKPEMLELNDLDWHYQLPSPPNGFRDCSPTKQLKCDSVATSPELFEKLKQLDESSTKSSVKNEEMFNKLSLENLEKRKSLVYNRELATSLKFAPEDDDKEKFGRVVKELEDAKNLLATRSKTVPTTPAPAPVPVVQNDNGTLPNFKITTYAYENQNPKKSINIFEDDSIRSSTEARRSSAEYRRSEFVKNKPNYSSAPNKYQNEGSSVVRSGSFSSTALDNHWSPANPVKRSKSQVALNHKYKDEDTEKNEPDSGLAKSNSLFDVSGLQSLEVMRKIQTQLNTAPQPAETSNQRVFLPKLPETNDRISTSTPNSAELPQSNPKIPANSTIAEDNSKLLNNSVKDGEKTVPHYHYRGPPAINLGTWTERPKTQVSIKEDTDYKYKKEKDNINSKIVVNGINHLKAEEKPQGISIKVNGNLDNAQSNGVIIKIGPQKEFVNRFLNLNAPVAFRKPFSSINKNENAPRPHSIAISDSQDYQPPIVRSVEYKKPFQNGKSVTQIYSTPREEPRSLNFNAHAQETNHLQRKPLSRVSSYVQNFEPTVRGFRSFEPPAQAQTKPWPAYGTLPSKAVVEEEASKKEDTVTNRASLFGDVVLRNNRQNLQAAQNRHSIAVDQVKSELRAVPIAPKFCEKKAKPSTARSSDNRGQLLDDIRRFGGKKGLRTVKT